MRNGPAPIELDRATVRGEHSAQDADQRRFSGAVVADETRDLPGDNVDRDIVQRDDPAEPLAEWRARKVGGLSPLLV